MEKMFYLYGKENKKIYIFNEPLNRLYRFEFMYRYDNLKNVTQYKIIKIEDDIEVYKNLMREKTGITPSSEELEELKFSNITSGK